MRTAILVNFVPPQRVSFYRALAERLGDVRFFVSTDMERNRQWQVDTEALSVERQRTLTLPTRWRHPLGSGGKNYVHIPYGTVADLTRFQPNVVVSAELGARTALAAAYCKRWGIPLVIWVDVAESTEMGRGWLRRALRWALLRPHNSVIVNGNSGKRYVSRLGVKADRVAIVALPLEKPYDRALAPATHQGGSRRLLYCGRLLALKGVAPFLEVLARCVAELPRQQIQMTFVGSGPESETLRKVEVPPNLTVVFRGEVPYEQVATEYEGHDILVLPTFGDTWGQVVAEGMACGLAVLGSSRSQAVEELVEDNVTGWVFDPVSAQEMEGAISRALSADGPTLRSMGCAAQEVARKLTPARSAEAMVEAIRAAERTRRAPLNRVPRRQGWLGS